jgi:ribonuclease M5
MKMKMKIEEVIVVEGRDDIINLRQYIDAEFIATHGYGISTETLQRIEKAYDRKGIIIFTDPDFAGEKIRKRLNERFPEAKNAFVSKEDATRKDDIGVENAQEEAIRAALKKVRKPISQTEILFLQIDLLRAGLTGQIDSAKRRNEIGKILGIGYANGKQLLNRLNGYGITREEFTQAMKEVDNNEE